MTAGDSYSVIGAARRFALGGLATHTRVQDLPFGVTADRSGELIIGVRHQRACVRVTMSSRPPETRPDRLGISTGSKLPARSRGTSRPTGPIEVCTFLQGRDFGARLAADHIYRIPTTSSGPGRCAARRRPTGTATS